jgi:hypothetical protein
VAPTDSGSGREKRRNVLMEEKLCSSCGLCMIKEWPAKVRDYYYVTFYYPELKKHSFPGMSTAFLKNMNLPRIHREHRENKGIQHYTAET